MTNNRSKVLITTVPFGDKNRLPIKLLEDNGVEYLVNPIGRKLKEEELIELVQDFNIIIAGTEPITSKVLKSGGKLEFISRVGIGLDSVDLLTARSLGIGVSYTPDAPAPAVVELTIGIMLTLLRSVHLANTQMHKGLWNRYFGRRISEVTIGVIGLGRIGSGVIKGLRSLNPRRLLVNDIKDKAEINLDGNIEFVSKEEIYKSADVISLHLPLTSETHNMITIRELQIMKNDSVLINTSRGGIINENDLFTALSANMIAFAALDVFEEEPYTGKLKELENVLLTSHMGSMSIDCRTTMEIEATKEVIRYLLKEPLVGTVPKEEYDIQEFRKGK